MCVTLTSQQRCDQLCDAHTHRIQSAKSTPSEQNLHRIMESTFNISLYNCTEHQRKSIKTSPVIFEIPRLKLLLVKMHAGYDSLHKLCATSNLLLKRVWSEQTGQYLVSAGAECVTPIGKRTFIRQHLNRASNSVLTFNKNKIRVSDCRWMVIWKRAKMQKHQQGWRFVRLLRQILPKASCWLTSCSY